MTKKDYIIIAKAIKPFYNDADEVVIELINSITQALANDNPRFDNLKFLEYLRE